MTLIQTYINVLFLKQIQKQNSYCYRGIKNIKSIDAFKNKIKSNDLWDIFE